MNKYQESINALVAAKRRVEECEQEFFDAAVALDTQKLTAKLEAANADNQQLQENNARLKAELEKHTVKAEQLRKMLAGSQNTCANLRADLEGTVKMNSDLAAAFTERGKEITQLKRLNHEMANERNAALARQEVLKDKLNASLAENEETYRIVADRLNACEFVLKNMGITVKYKT